MERPPIRRLRKACVSCRSLKIKCIPANAHALSKDPCARCSKLEIHCQYVERPPRRRPAGSSTMTRAMVVSGDAVPMDDTFDLALCTPDSNPTVFGLSQQGLDVSLDQRGDSHASYPSGSQPAMASVGLSPSSAMSLHASSSSAPDWASRNPADVHRHLEPYLGIDDSRPASPRRQEGTTPSLLLGDERGPTADKELPAVHPVSLGIVTESEAKMMCRFFLSRMVEISHILDTVYHTYERIRTSPVLLTAVLAVVARFRRPELVVELDHHVDRLLTRDMYRGTVDFEMILALLITTHWKPPDDRSAYMKLGVALRAACELRLGDTMHLPLPADETAARARLARERAWLSLFGYEIVYSNVFRLPSSMASLRPSSKDVRSWRDAHRHLNIGVDTHIAITATVLDIIEPSRPAPVAGLSVVSFCADALVFETWANKWFREPDLTPLHRFILRYLGATATLGSRSEAVKSLPNAANKNALFACLDDLAEMNEEIAGMGLLSFLNDVSIIGSVAPGFMLYQLRELLSDSELERAMSIMRNFLDIIASVTYRYAGDPLSGAARTYERLFKAFHRLRHQRSAQVDISQTNAVAAGLNVSTAPLVLGQEDFWDFLQGMCPEEPSSDPATTAPLETAVWMLPV